MKQFFRWLFCRRHVTYRERIIREKPVRYYPLDESGQGEVQYVG